MDKKHNKIEEIGKKSPFKAPEGYFGSLPDQIMSKLSDVEVEQAPVPNQWDRIKPWIYMAAMFAGIALMFKLFKGDFNRSDSLTVSNSNNQIKLDSSKEENTDELVYDYMEYEAIRANYRETVFIGEN